MDYSTLRKTYTSELTNFYQGGAFPKNVSADLRYGLDCQRKRVAKFGLTMQKKFEKDGADDIGQGPVYLRKSDAEIALEEKQKNALK